VLAYLRNLPRMQQLLYFRAEPNASTLRTFCELGEKAVPVHDWTHTLSVLPLSL
jgi:hypothetical protein